MQEITQLLQSSWYKNQDSKMIMNDDEVINIRDANYRAVAIV